MIIRCTGKLLKEIGVGKSKAIPPVSHTSLLGDWHAHLLYIDRHKCVLFVNDRTRFNFIVPDIPRAQIRTLSRLFEQWLRCVLSDENVALNIQNQIFEEYAPIEYAPSNNRSVLGSINDLAYHYKHAIFMEGGVHSPVVPEIIREMNRMPMSPLRYKDPIRMLKELYESAT